MKKNFNEIDLCFEDISWLFNETEYFQIEPLDDVISFNGFSNEYKTFFGKIIVGNFNTVKQTKSEINIKNDFEFKFIFNNSVSYNEVYEKIYAFRNLLLILGRRYFDIKRIKLNDIELIDCFEEYLYNPLSKQYLEYLDHHTITLSEIDNFGEVVTNFLNLYDKIISIIDSFFVQTKYNLPDKVSFFNACSMIEDYVNLFLIEEAKANGEEEAANNKMKYIKKCINDMINEKIIVEEQKADVEIILYKHVKKNENLSFKEKVMALVKNVNNSFNFSDSEIKIIAENFRDARRAFAHNGMFIDEIFSPYISTYCHFTDDLIYLNILKQIGIDITKSQFECIEFNYSKSDLTVVLKYDTQ